MCDLFQEPKTIKEQLKDWLLSRNWTFSHEVLDWSRDPRHPTTRADRTARELAEEGYIRRMTEDEKRSIGVFKNEDIWIPVR